MLVMMLIALNTEICTQGGDYIACKQARKNTLDPIRKVEGT